MVILLPIAAYYLPGSHQINSAHCSHGGGHRLDGSRHALFGHQLHSHDRNPRRSGFGGGLGEMMNVLKKTFHRIGSAIASSGLTVVFGFSALIFSPFMITNNFGAVTVLSMVVALLMTFTVFPVLLIELEGRRDKMTADMAGLKCRARNLVSR
jgi:hypothetical protein